MSCFIYVYRVERGTTYYLVKWRDSNYDMATWEPEDSEIPEFKKAIENYENLRWAFRLLFKTHIFDIENKEKLKRNSIERS